jgi:hypothetical protein
VNEKEKEIRHTCGVAPRAQRRSCCTAARSSACMRSMSSNLTAVRSCSAPHWVHTHRGFPLSPGRGIRSAPRQRSKVVQRVAVAAWHAHQAWRHAGIAERGVLPKGVDADELQGVAGDQPDFFPKRSRQSEHRTGKFGEFDGQFGEGEV